MPWSVRNLRSKATGPLIDKGTLELAFGAVGMALSLRAVYALLRWNQLRRIEAKLDELKQDTSGD